MSATRKRYTACLIGRILIFALCATAFFVWPEQFEILEGFNFFKSFSPFHILWVIWVWDMIRQIIPMKSKIALGSQKLFANRFRPIKEKINREALKRHIRELTAAAYKVLALWMAGLIAVGIIYFAGLIDKNIMFMLTVFLYVCDLLFVLVWCPLRFIMKNKCCTTCRIFNWDHLMMFSPLIFLGGFFSISIVVLAAADLIMWEISIILYPERFSEMTNTALRCTECTDKLCAKCNKKEKCAGKQPKVENSQIIK